MSREGHGFCCAYTAHIPNWLEWSGTNDASNLHNAIECAAKLLVCELFVHYVNETINQIENGFSGCSTTIWGIATEWKSYYVQQGVLLSPAHFHFMDGETYAKIPGNFGNCPKTLKIMKCNEYNREISKRPEIIGKL